MFKKKRVLLLCNYNSSSAGTIIDHINAFTKYSENDYYILSIYGQLPEWLDLSRFDALIIHYSLILSNDKYVSASTRMSIRKFSGFKAAFIQDDYRWINDTVHALSYIGIHALFPLTGLEIINQVYNPAKLPGVRYTPVLAGYAPQNLIDMKVKPYFERNIDVGYRARKLPAWMGSHTLQKWQIADKFLSDALDYGLKVDLSYKEEDRIYGDEWIKFISNCKGALGTESGASVCDFTGNIMRNVETHLNHNPNASFDELRNLYFKNEDKKIIMNVISPRCFEMAALRTLMILYEGSYSGVLKPWRHYVPLKQDHSNMDDVVRVLRSKKVATKIIQQAYEEIAKNTKYSYRALVQIVDRVIREEWRPSLVSANKLYSKEEFEFLKINLPVTTNLITQQPLYQYSFYFKKTKNTRISNKTLKFSLRPHVNWKSMKFYFKKNVRLKRVGILWEAADGLTPDYFKIICIKNSKVVDKCYIKKNFNKEGFQQIEYPLNSTIDTIKIFFDKSDKAIKISEISFIGIEPPFSIFIKKIKFIFYKFLSLIWNNFSEQTKKKYFRLANKIKLFFKAR